MHGFSIQLGVCGRRILIRKYIVFEKNWGCVGAGPMRKYMIFYRIRDMCDQDTHAKIYGFSMELRLCEKIKY